jgi:hypothetical protein
MRNIHLKFSFILLLFIIAPLKLPCHKHKYCYDRWEFKTVEKDLLIALYFYNIKNPKIVYKQAILETGNFKSPVYLRTHNLFGLCDSKGYYCFNKWEESIKAYIKYVEYKYKNGEDYYHFLKRIKYAKDKNYIKKLRLL